MFWWKPQVQRGFRKLKEDQLNVSTITGLKETGLFGSVGGTKPDANSGGGIRIGVEIKGNPKGFRSCAIMDGGIGGPGTHYNPFDRN